MRGIETDCTGQNEEKEAENGRVTKVEDGGNEFVDFEIVLVVIDRVQKHVKRTRTWRQERAPPPMPILRCELEIHHYDGDLSAGDGKDEQDEEEEAKHVVDTMQPNGGEDEVEFDEDGAKGQDAAHQNGRNGS